MFVAIHSNVDRRGHTVTPFEFDVLDDTRFESVTPARVDDELPAHARVLERPFVGKSRLLEQLAARSVGMRLTGIEAARNGLPEVERACSP